jgi:CRP-like cAMP-binding protein
MRMKPGERIDLDPDSALVVQEGVVTLTVIHEDGSEVLLGLYGPGHVFAGHSMRGCCTQISIHTSARVSIEPWTAAVCAPGFSDGLRNRLRTMEAWAAMQARPHIEQRLLGILSLLADQFGRSTPRGMLIEVRITHAQLASAIGATRATVTRCLGMLRRRGRLLSVGSGAGERLCLREERDRR